MSKINEEISQVLEQAHQRGRGILSAYRDVLDVLDHLVSKSKILQRDELRKKLGKTPAEQYHALQLFAAFRKVDTLFHLEVSTSSITVSEGHAVGSMTSFFDITDRKRMEKALRESSKKIGTKADCHER